jgi:hypothetical protein
MMSKKTFMPRACAASTSARRSALVPEVRVDLREVGDPVAVVAGGRTVF